MDNVQGKVAVITGGASGVGLALAQVLAREGARLVIADIEQEALDTALAGLKASGAEAVGLRTDVTKRDQVEALADFSWETFGRVDMLAALRERVEEQAEMERRHGVATIGGVGGPQHLYPALLQDDVHASLSDEELEMLGFRAEGAGYTNRIAPRNAGDLRTNTNRPTPFIPELRRT